MNRTAMIQKRIWLLRVSAVASVMLAPSPKVAARALLAENRRLKLWVAAWRVQTKGSSDQCGNWINDLGRKLPNPQWIRALAGPETLPGPDCHCRYARRHTALPAPPALSPPDGNAHRRNAVAGPLPAPARRRCRRAPKP